MRQTGLYAFLKDALRRFLPSALRAPLYNLAWRLKNLLIRRRLEKIVVAPPDRRYQPGVNLIGPFSHATGLGESVRILSLALAAGREPLALVDLGEALEAESPPALRYDLNIIHVNPPDLGPVWRKLGHSTWDGRYNIAFWAWELETFPAAWRPAFDLFNEIWTPSEFVARAIRKETDLPVLSMPYAMAPQAGPSNGRRRFGLPEGVFLFLIAADAYSVFERKNPLGAVEAFVRAFKPNEAGIGLVIKLRHTPQDFLRSLRAKLVAYPHVYYLEELLNKEEFNGLIECVDAFISLHRAEGFGLVMAEAMFLGTPCVATNWSANTEFMTPETAALVDYKLVRIGRDIGPFPRQGRWAEPDIGQAAAWLRRLAYEPGLGRSLAAAAARHVREILSPARLSARLSARLAEIRQ